jgi:hypothetical protein
MPEINVGVAKIVITIRTRLGDLEGSAVETIV